MQPFQNLTWDGEKLDQRVCKTVYLKQALTQQCTNLNYSIISSNYIVLATVAPQKVKRHAGALRFESTALVNRILNEIDNGKGIMFPLETIQLATFNVAFNFALGARFNSYQDEKYRVLKDLLDENFAFEDLKYEVPNFIPALYHPLHHLFGKSELESYVKRHDSIMLPIIREAGTKDGENMIKMLRENGSELSEEELLVLTGECHRIIRPIYSLIFNIHHVCS